MTDQITINRATVEQALEALKYMHDEKCDYMRRNNLGDPLREHAARLALPAIEALEAALAQQQAEPVQYHDSPAGYESTTLAYTRWVSPQQFAKFSDEVKAWYRPYWVPKEKQQAEPVQRKPLTDKEMRHLWSQYGYKSALCMQFARALEAAHGIKEAK